MPEKTIANGKVKLVHGSGHTDIYDKGHYENLRLRLAKRQEKIQGDITETDKTLELIDASVE